MKVIQKKLQVVKTKFIFYEQIKLVFNTVKYIIQIEF